MRGSEGTDEWAEPEPAGWFSSSPGVFHRVGAPEGLAILRGAARPPAPDTDASSSKRRFRGVPWRVVGLAVGAVVVILALARAAGTGPGVGAVPVGWEPTGAVASASSRPAASSGSSSATEQARPSGPAAPSTSAAAGTAAIPAPDSSTGPPAGPGEPDWWDVLAELDRRRAVALAETDVALLRDYAQPRSPAWESDEALILDLSARGLRPEGLTARVLAIEGVDLDGARATVQAVDKRSGYTLVDEEGEVVQVVEPSLASRWLITLEKAGSDGAALDGAGADKQPSTEGAGRDPTDRGTGSEAAAPASDPGWRVVEVVPDG